MTKQTEALKQLKDVHKQQGNAGNWDYDNYMRGLYNGLELALSLFESREPVYKQALAEAEKQALEQPAQEYLTRAQQVIRANNSAQEPVPLIRHENGNFSPAPSWQSLSDDEIDNIWSMNFEFGFRACARAIEQALKEKNHERKF